MVTAINDRKVVESNKRLFTKDYGNTRNFVAQVDSLKRNKVNHVTTRSAIQRIVKETLVVYTDDRERYMKNLGIPERTIRAYKGVDNLFNYMVARDGIALYEDYKKKNGRR